MRMRAGLRMISMHGASAFNLPASFLITDDCPLTTDPELTRAISTGRLRALPRFHIRPIDVMVYHGPRGDLV